MIRTAWVRRSWESRSRCGSTCPARCFTTDAGELLTVPLRRVEARVGDMVVVGDPDAVSVPFVDIASIAGEWPDGQAVLKSTGGPYLLGDGWCALLDG